MGHWNPFRRNLIDTYFAKVHALRASDALFLKTALFTTVIFFLLFLIGLSTKYMIATPAYGGTLSEGVVGTPRFVNPVLAVTRADKDLATLVYDGLMRLGSDGTLVPNIAESITMSDDGLTYNVVMKQNITFHDGVPLTARDVAFTIARIQEPLLNSPLRANFDGILVEVIGEYELNIILPDAYSPFMENLTFGILPEHIWKNAGSEDFPFSQYNSEPIGSGPYAIKEITRNTSGIPEMYTLTSHEAYHLGQPKIETLELRFFPTEEKLVEAFKKGVVESTVAVDAHTLPAFNLNGETHHLERIPLPRTFAVFINQNKSPALRDLSARKALDIAVPRSAIVETILGGYGNTLTTPIPVGFGGQEQSSEVLEANADTARDVLRDGGWKMNEETNVWEKKIDDTVTPLRFSISTMNGGDFTATAELLRSAWAGIGADVTVKQFEQSDFTQSIIRPRDYEALLFGIQVERSLDLYSFWHSSQRNDPGLNVALYANITTDSILSEMRRGGTAEQTDAIARFTEEIRKEVPAIFLYTPELLYIFPNTVHGASWKGVGEAHERFSNIHEWYTQTESLWSLFK